MESQMIFRKLLRTSVALIGAFALVGGAHGAPGNGKGGGGGGGGGDGDAGEPPDYGDLVILYRNESGVPELTGDSCQQPIAFPSDTCLIDEETFGCAEYDGEACLTWLVPVDPATCAVTVTGCTHEIEFGRTNSARAPATVFEAQLEDVVVKLATADQIGLDASGRLVACVDGGVDDEGAFLPDTSSAVDSPLQNLAIYKQLMTVGYLGAYNQITLPDSVLNTAARGIGVASDKGGKVGVDMVVYLNQIMGLSDPGTDTILNKICIDVKEEVMGNIELVQKCFLDYGHVPPEIQPDDGAYGYGRKGNFEALPKPAYINDGTEIPEGKFEVLEFITDTNPPNFGIYRGSIFDRVFRGDEGKGTTNIGAFVEAADDTREVINYMHSWPLPVEYVAEDDTVTSFLTPVSCDGIEGAIRYDLSISADSGLQVPVQMVPTEEGREFIVTIANAGPDMASGSVWVHAETTGDAEVWTLLVDEFGELILDDDLLPQRDSTGPFEFEFTDNDPLSWTTKFTVFPAEATKITWTATIVADHDVNDMNNSVTETTNVNLTGKGGGGGGRGGQ